MRRELGVLLAGIATIAVTYGFARYAFGLFVPPIAASLELSDTLVGLVGGASHLGYAVGLLVAPSWCRRHRAGVIAAGAGVTAAVGLAGVAASRGVWTLGVAVALGGMASGLASPALARLVVAIFAPEVRSAAQTWVNSGTSVGLAVSAPTVLLAASWRATWAVLAAVSLATAAVVAATVRGRERTSRAAPPSAARPPRRPRAIRPRDVRLVGFCTVLGATSAGYWTFSVQRVTEAGLAAAWSTWFWVTIGVVGLAGGRAGAQAARIGLPRTVQRWALLWTASLATLGLPTVAGPLALASAAGFGAAFMALTGLAIVWATEVHDDAATGVRACFLSLGVGQAVGTPAAGAIADAVGAPAAFLTAAAVSLLLLAPVVRPTDRAVRANHPERV
ncbi:MFS transporter [Nitriliruptor alkaliphilus]|uniref:MFS transporter n=1 Tax=Nitriliruptor alkaliphilus TaxID=427918 RepID=UPI000696C725|nr:MFS transporter [Nitriliruptor alkaliphilus]